ncbi:endolytic transglycosylase MltG [Merismopedia glauca]|uniref:Endolytic murein transglycosylase n=1 Tax=Merismopedia glauca CCAP 1448/3 TaxID=1296344 RepID=A0A2T1C3V5_9CYAN|nr:endolytic transglycosylase MltG [Merismopedia glauca]PSB02960.1 endolytic transglycosylase MltG [Merismopedia glauca CCAP 1448/3]
MTKSRHQVYYLLGILVSIPLLLGIGGWAWWNWAISPVGASQKVTVQIPPGSAPQAIGEELEKAGLIRSQLVWNLWSKYLSWQNPQGEFKAGTYQLSPSQSLPEIATEIRQGKAVKQEVEYTIKEGWSLQQMAAYFAEEGFFSKEEFLAAVSQIPKDKFPWLPDGLPNLEGFVYPETYKIPQGSLTPQAVIEQMLREFEKVALPVYQQHQSQTQMSLLQWVTLASIVEKESVVAPERPLIAGVFTNRLQKGMRLESDPTVEYGLKIKQTADKPLTIAQVRTPSPYNTYLNAGLPPGPIASPGLPSLEATLMPKKTDYLFFVARYDGTHVFTSNLRDHINATNKIRQQRQNRSQKSEVRSQKLGLNTQQLTTNRG